VHAREVISYIGHLLLILLLPSLGDTVRQSRAAFACWSVLPRAPPLAAVPPAASGVLILVFERPTVLIVRYIVEDDVSRRLAKRCCGEKSDDRRCEVRTRGKVPLPVASSVPHGSKTHKSLTTIFAHSAKTAKIS
jgi:hypothetical protein